MHLHAHSSLFLSLHTKQQNNNNNNSYNYNNNCFMALCPGLHKQAGIRRNIHPLIPILIINHPLSASSIYYNPQHHFCSIYVLDSLFAPPLSRSFLVYLLVWNPPLHTPYIFSPNHCLLFATYAHTNAACFAVVPRLCHPFLVSLSTLYLELYLLLNVTHLSDLSHLCPLKCHLIFFPYRPDLTCMQHTTSHTTAVQSPSHNQLCISIGKQWYQLPEFIPSNLNPSLHSCIVISIHTQHVI